MMNKFSLATLPILIAGFMTTPALAQDEDAGNWTGPYIGGSLGYSWQPNISRDTNESLVFDTNSDGNFNNTVTTAGGANAFSPGFCRGRALTNSVAPCAGDKDGRIAFSGHAGYDLQFGNIVVGASVEGGRSMIGNSVSGFSTTPASYVLSRRIDWDANARLRAGYALGTGTLIYGTGGLAFAKIKNEFNTSNAQNTFTQSNTNQSEWGWTAGGGIEQKVSQHFSIGLLYRYTRFNTDPSTVTVGRGTAAATNPFIITPSGSTDIRRSNDVFEHQTVRVTASYRF
jgi:outer membrane immunogenic protein